MLGIAGKIKFHISDVRDWDFVKNAMHGMAHVFFVATLKQVSSCECFSIEVVKANVFGTENVLTVVIDAGIKNLVCLSEDKGCIW